VGAARDTRFAQIEIKRGIIPTGGALIRMVERAGWGNAMRYLLTGDEFDAHTAQRLGFVQEVTLPGEELDRALAIAIHIAEQAPLAVQASLASSRLAVEHGAEAAIAEYEAVQQRLSKTEDATEGVSAFTERRKARFRGA
jgi:enoyl-CoA hydratase